MCLIGTTAVQWMVTQPDRTNPADRFIYMYEVAVCHYFDKALHIFPLWDIHTESEIYDVLQRGVEIIFNQIPIKRWHDVYMCCMHAHVCRRAVQQYQICLQSHSPFLISGLSANLFKQENGNEGVVVRGIFTDAMSQITRSHRGARSQITHIS